MVTFEVYYPLMVSCKDGLFSAGNFVALLLCCLYCLCYRSVCIVVREAILFLPTTEVPVIDEAGILNRLSCCVRCVTCKQQVIPGLYSPSKTHEDHRITCESSCHRPRNNFLVFAQVSDGSQRKTPVCNRSPKVSTEEILASCWRPQPGEEIGRAHV